MSTKLIAMGNVLMGDDGVAIFITRLLEKELLAMGIEVIYGETDIGYLIAKIEMGDYLILIDSARFGKQPGDITVIPICCSGGNDTGLSQHDVRFIDILTLYYPEPEGILLAIEAADISFRYGISTILMDRAHGIAFKLLSIIKSIGTQHKNADI